MRPVNLVPPEQRRGERAPLRSGPLAYVLVGFLAVALAAITSMVLTQNQIAEAESEKASLEVQHTEALARAAALRPYAEFASLQAARTATVASLAQSRFDWERVMRELALVIPEDVWLVEIAGTAGPEVQVEGAGIVTTRSNAAGPALEFVGCGSGQDAVARFVAALEDIDGVTRVGVQSSERPENVIEAAEAGTEETSEECRIRDFVAKFEIIAAFDEAPVAASASATPIAPPATEPATEPVAPEGQEQVEESRDAADEQTGKANDAAGLVGAGE